MLYFAIFILLAAIVAISFAKEEAEKDVNDILAKLKSAGFGNAKVFSADEMRGKDFSDLFPEKRSKKSDSKTKGKKSKDTKPDDQSSSKRRKSKSQDL